MNYLDTIRKEVLDYYKVLEPNFPQWLVEYINTDILLKQQYISVSCGDYYTKLSNNHFFYSSLEHSIGVALICWHFTHDKKITLAGLFHDVATPVFKHCIDFLNGDYLEQESTEDLTSQIIKSSSQVMQLLKRDNIELCEIEDYHLYSIADNDAPRLASDRLEYSLSNGLLIHKLWDLNEVENLYDNITIQNNENKDLELGFTDEKFAIKFVEVTTKLSLHYRADKVRFSMQCLADIVRKLNNDNLITLDDLYNKKESEIIDIIQSSKYKDVFDKWANATEINISKQKPDNVYWVNQRVKVRYIDPLCNGKRISRLSSTANTMIRENLAFDMDKYLYLDFNF